MVLAMYTVNTSGINVTNLQIITNIPIYHPSHDTHSMRLRAVPSLESLSHLPHKKPTIKEQV